MRAATAPNGRRCLRRLLEPDALRKAALAASKQKASFLMLLQSMLEASQSAMGWTHNCTSTQMSGSNWGDGGPAAGDNVIGEGLEALERSCSKTFDLIRSARRSRSPATVAIEALAQRTASMFVMMASCSTAGMSLSMTPSPAPCTIGKCFSKMFSVLTASATSERRTLTWPMMASLLGASCLVSGSTAAACVAGSGDFSATAWRTTLEPSL
mmetsp:Transcript_139608/g.446728  ORF Transcript_139608/g.446728 Transcript_139608/m.446728 type:complete len:212 (+) Transcript_139608:313-948(+)